MATTERWLRLRLGSPVAAAILGALLDFEFTLPTIDGYIYSSRLMKLIHVGMIYYNKDDGSMIDWHVDGPAPYFRGLVSVHRTGQGALSVRSGGTVVAIAGQAVGKAGGGIAGKEKLAVAGPGRWLW